METVFDEQRGEKNYRATDHVLVRVRVDTGVRRGGVGPQTRFARRKILLGMSIVKTARKLDVVMIVRNYMFVTPSRLTWPARLSAIRWSATVIVSGTLQSCVRYVPRRVPIVIKRIIIHYGQRPKRLCNVASRPRPACTSLSKRCWESVSSNTAKHIYLRVWGRVRSISTHPTRNVNINQIPRTAFGLADLWSL